jgi:hypothetical protein
MKRVVAILMVAALMAVMLAGPASAQGCADFGEHTSSEAKDSAFRPLGQTLIYFFGTGSRSALVHEEQSGICS